MPAPGAMAASFASRPRDQGGNYDSRWDSWLLPRVDGRFTGTTDEILQWAACKWGLPDDLIRADAVVESTWFQYLHFGGDASFGGGGGSCYWDYGCGDAFSSPTAASTTYCQGIAKEGLTSATVHDYQLDPVTSAGGYPYATPQAGMCPKTFSLLGVMSWDDPAWEAPYPAYPGNQNGTFPFTRDSTAAAADYWGARIRGCYEGWETWLSGTGTGTYAAGDLWGCIGAWYDGAWHDSAAATYISNVQTEENNHTWLTSSFDDSKSQYQCDPTYGCPDSAPDTTPPTSPGGFRATGNTTTSVSTTWSASTDPDSPVAGYNVYVNGTKVGSTNSTSYTFTSLACGTSYTLAVSAYDPTGNASGRSQITASTAACGAPDTTPPPVPTGLTATAGNAQVGLTWKASTDPDGDTVTYNVYRGGTKVASNVGSTSYTETGLANGTSYSYTVTAVDSHGNESAQSAAVSATPQAPSGTPPHIMVILMENHGAGAIIGNSSAPFQNSLTTKYITLTNWTGVDHPSSPNYVALVTGQDNGVAGVGDCSPSIGSSCDWTGNNFGNQLYSAGIPMAWFAEDLSGNGCSISNSESGNDVNHEPWAYMDMWQSTAGACAEAGLATTSPSDPQVISTLNGANPPDFVWVTPNLTDDSHNGTVAQGDTYLQNLVTAVQGTSWYANGGTIVITYDEDEGETNPTGYCTKPVVIPAVGATCVPTFIVSAKDANVGADATPGDHYGLLRSLEECYALPLLNNAGAVNSSGQATYGDIKSRLC